MEEMTQKKKGAESEDTGGGPEANNSKEELAPLTPEQQILVEQGLWQVIIVAKKMLSQFPVNLFELNDFISWGTIGLIRAARRFDLEIKIKFSSFAERSIRGAILDGVRSMDILSRDHRKFLKQVEEAKEKLRKTLLCNPSEEEIAQELGLSLKDFRERKVEYTVTDQSNIQKFDLPDITNNTNPEVRLRQQEMRRILDEIMKSLTEREKQVIILLFSEEMSATEIAEVLGVNESRVSQLKKAALKKLKKGLKQLKIFSAE